MNEIELLQPVLLAWTVKSGDATNRHSLVVLRNKDSKYEVAHRIRPTGITAQDGGSRHTHAETLEFETAKEAFNRAEHIVLFCECPSEEKEDGFYKSWSLLSTSTD